MTAHIVSHSLSDALSSNLVTVLPIKAAHCNAHARRQFYDIESLYPSEVDWVLEMYGKIWEADDEAKEKKMNPEQRLAYHRQHSLPVMQSIRAWGEAKLATDDFEEHSALGRAIKYFLRHYDIH